jgi:hypothetical protein
MIDFRYHIVSIVAVFLALALGLFLGSTTLQSTVTDNLSKQAKHVTGQNRTLEATNRQLSGELKAEQGLTAALEPYAVSDRLTGASVALVSAPGVNGKVRKSLTNTLQLAGASVTADVQLQASYLDPTQDAELGQLAQELVLPGHTLPSGNGVTQVSAELADVLVTRPGRKLVARRNVNQTLNALEDGKFINVSGTLPNRPATLAILLLAGPTSGLTPAQAQQQNTVLLNLGARLRASSTGEVVAGPTPVPGVSGDAFSAALADATLLKLVSTVALDSDNSNGHDAAAGRIAVVLALANAPLGTVGQYGLGGSSTPLPSASPTP